ncbi:ESPR-type extended signal peptide-containing protein, partial [Psychrobacter alimentarius]
GSKDAVNGDQLNTTNTNVTNNTTAIGDINAGRSGIVRQDAGTGAITVGATTGGTSVNFANSTGGARTLSGVADGNIAANSTDAVNGGQVNTLVNTVTNQINATNANVADNTNRSTGNLAALGGGAEYDAANNIYTQP